MTTTDNTRYFINGKEVTANRYAAMKRLNNYIGLKISRGQMEAPTRAAWYTYEAAADAEYDIARYLENCKRFGYLNEEETDSTTDTPANESEESELTEKAVISLPKYYTETPERLQLLARNMADQYQGLNDQEAKRMKALYLDIAGAPEYFLKNNLIKAI